jgi:APA family basic amino acid/polyamine antiporter
VQPSQLEPRRDLTLTHATSLVVGITIGTGVFLKSAAMAQAVGTPALVLCAWVVAGMVALIGALCFSELGAMLPDAGGEYVYLRAAFGEVPGFLYACNSFLLGGASIAAYGAAVAIFISDIHVFDHAWFSHTFNLLGTSFTWQFGTRQLLAIGVIAVFAAINCAGVMLGGRVQTILTVAKVVAIAGVVVGVFLFSGTHDAANLATAPHAATGGFSGFGAALLAAVWAYSGWQYLPMAASEVRDPQRNLPRAIIGGTLLVLVIYLLVNSAYLYALPFWQVATSNSTAYPDAPSVAARAVQTFLGARAAAVASLIFLISTVGSLNGTILTRARVSYASARDGLFFSPFARLSPHTRVPVTSLVLLCIWGAVLAASGTFDQLTNMAVMSYALFWIPVTLAVIVLRRRRPEAVRPFRVPAYPWVPLLMVVIMAWIVVSALITTPKEAITTIVLILLGLPLYPFFRRRGRHRAVTPTPAPRA